MDFWQLMEQTGAEEKLVVLDYLCVFACFSRFEDVHLKLSDNCSDNGGLLEYFFIAHSKRSGKTSNHTLSKLNHPRMDLKSLKCELAAVPCRFDNISFW